jgi:hypothetical protein
MNVVKSESSSLYTLDKIQKFISLFLSEEMILMLLSFLLNSEVNIL